MEDEIEFNQDKYESLMVDNKTPLDILIEQDEYRDLDINDVKRDMIQFLARTIDFIVESKDSKLAAIGVQYALGISVEESARSKARSLGVSSGTISSYKRAYDKCVIPSKTNQ